MRVFTDQMGREVALPQFPPRRIVSLVPSQTELLADLGLENEVVGITKFCVRPAAWFREKARVGGTKTVDFQKVAALQPDLILANKEENERGQIEELARHFPVWVSDIFTLDDALGMIRAVGQLTRRAKGAEILAQKINRQFCQLPVEPACPTSNVQCPTSCVYLIWRKPYMAAGDDTFINSMLRAAGFENALAGQLRYPEISRAALAAMQPEVILLSSEPYPFTEKHVAELREICPKANIELVDGEMFSWYGSRLLLAPAYFLELRRRVFSDNPTF